MLSLSMDTLKVLKRASDARASNAHRDNNKIVARSIKQK
jgi:hypothetical protein